MSGTGGNRMTIVQTCVPPYRARFFEALLDSDPGGFSLLAGDRCLDPRLRGLPRGEGPARGTLDVQTIGDRLVWYPGLREALEGSSICVLELNVRVLNSVTLLMRRRGRLGVVLWGHGFGRRSGEPSRRLRIAMARRADAVILYGARAREPFVRAGVDPSKLHVAPNGVDVRRIVERLRSIPPTPERHILYVGRLIPEKRVDLVIRAVAVAGPRLDDGVQLVIVGDGPERPRLTELAGRIAPTRVRFEGERWDEDGLASLYAGSFVCIQPGVAGLAVIEGLAHRTPVVVPTGEAHGPEVEALIPGENALSFPAGNAEALARRIIELARDPDRARAMGRAGQERVLEGHSLERMIEVFRAVRADVAARRARS
jgi:glycosyltransferase involved in cell wall biosynthesis